MGGWRGRGHDQCGWVRGLGGTYLERGHVEGGQDASHSGWMAAWCLTMSKSRCQVFLFTFTAEHFFLGRLLYLTAQHMQVAWGACVGDTAPKKLPPCPPLPCCHRPLHSLDIAPSMASMLMRTRPDPNHASSSPPPRLGEPPHRWRHVISHPMTTQDVPHSSGHAPAPLTCPAPSQRAAAIPHASHTPFVCPSPSHDLTHVPQPPSMRPNTFLRAPPCPFLMRCHHPRRVLRALHVLPISCSFS